MDGADDSEVAAVEGGDRRCAETFGSDDHARVDRAEREVGVGFHQLGDASELGGLEGLEGDRARFEFAEQAYLDGGACDPADQIGGLSDNQLRNDQRFSGGLEKGHAAVVIRIGADRGSDKRT